MDLEHSFLQSCPLSLNAKLALIMTVFTSNQPCLMRNSERTLLAHTSCVTIITVFVEEREERRLPQPSCRLPCFSPPCFSPSNSSSLSSPRLFHLPSPFYFSSLSQPFSSSFIYPFFPLQPRSLLYCHRTQGLVNPEQYARRILSDE